MVTFSFLVKVQAYLKTYNFAFKNTKLCGDIIFCSGL